MRKNLHLLDDLYLAPYAGVIHRRGDLLARRINELSATPGSLAEFACAHEYYGLHLRDGKWIFREWAPNAVEMALVGDFTNWRPSPEFSLKRLPGRSVWEGVWPQEAISHEQRYHLTVSWNGGQGERIPAYARRVVQNQYNNLFEAQVWHPEEPYVWKNPNWRITPGMTPLIYEAHIGMSQERPCVATYEDFKKNTLPRIIENGYNVIQLMAIMEHPYYASFGYHVGSFFAASSRFGTPDELKELIDEAHSAGVAVIMDLVHSHAVKNERDGLSRFDGTYDQYFHNGTRGWHEAWDSRCFDYAKPDVLHFLLSNCRFWLDEFRFDGFRFDGITSMLYLHHGIGVEFTDYSQYFDEMVDEDALAYCGLANTLIHTLRPDAITIAEDVSGMPGIASPTQDFGVGFDYRMAMGVPDCWFKLVSEVRDENWNIGFLWHELTNRRDEEKTVNYVESHDQALVGGKTLIFQMMDASIYDSMHRGVKNCASDRGVALHKIIRLATLATSGGAYLNFMGNEFGHPEWIDFPREGNHYSLMHARRQWSLRDDKCLLFSCLGDFDDEMIALAKHHGILSRPPRLLVTDDQNKILAFERAGLIFIFNFHATHSVENFPVLVPPGVYCGILNSDSERFGGQERIEENQHYPVTSEVCGTERVERIRIYLPSRTALILGSLNT